MSFTQRTRAPRAVAMPARVSRPDTQPWGEGGGMQTPSVDRGDVGSRPQTCLLFPSCPVQETPRTPTPHNQERAQDTGTLRGEGRKGDLRPGRGQRTRGRQQTPQTHGKGASALLVGDGPGPCCNGLGREGTGRPPTYAPEMTSLARPPTVPRRAHRKHSPEVRQGNLAYGRDPTPQPPASQSGRRG